MNDQIKISVIVPVYNAKKYLAECLDSVLHQNIQEMELLLVDDGSDDGSWELLQSYAAKHGHVSLFRQDRKRQGAARNLALHYAQGKYVTFVDADDVIPPHSYEKLYNTAELHDSKIVCGVIQSFDKDDAWVAVRLHKEQFGSLKTNFSVDQFPEILEDIRACNKLFRRSFINQHSIKFPEGCTGEDLGFTAMAFLHCGKISIIPDIVYRYRKHPYSTTTLLTPYFFEGRIAITANLKKLFENKGLSKEYHILLLSEIRKVMGSRFENLSSNVPKSDLFAIYDLLHEFVKIINSDDIRESGKFSTRMQIRLFLLQNKEYQALQWLENHPWDLAFSERLNDKNLLNQLSDLLARLYLQKIERLQRGTRAAPIAEKNDYGRVVTQTAVFAGQRQFVHRGIHFISKSFPGRIGRSLQSISFLIRLYVLSFLCLRRYSTPAVQQKCGFWNTLSQRIINHNFKKVLQSTRKELRKGTNSNTIDIFVMKLLRLFEAYIRRHEANS